MVQRKVLSKIGIQDDQLKSEKQLGNLKPINSQYPDGKNRGGADLKKKMKKSRSIKLTDIESFKSPLKQNISLPGKPPPLLPTTPNVQKVVATQKKQSVIKTPVASPNYMKSTSCSNAKKELTKVSPTITQTGSDRKNSSQINQKRVRVDSSPAKKAMKSLKKIPSFKLGKSPVKKRSKVALCADTSAHKATCSSTLKDSKFPDYIMLNPGGTELDGTSVKKVCPYTYCSLNGHFHAPLPPLKSFLSAKRRLMKTQKNKKLEALSPRRDKASEDGQDKIKTGIMVSDGNPSCQEEYSGSLENSSVIRDENVEFFIEIHAKDKDVLAEDDRAEKSKGVEDLNIKTRSEKHLNEHEVESLCDGSSCFEVDFEDNLDENIDKLLAEMEFLESLYQELIEEDVGIDYSSFDECEETTVQFTDTESDQEEENSGMGELDKSDSESFDMEWEEGNFSALCFDYEGEGDDTPQSDSLEKSILKPDAMANTKFEEITAEELLHGACEEDSISLDLKFDEDDSEPHGLYQDLDQELFQALESISDDHLNFPKDEFEDSTVEEEKDSFVETEKKSISAGASAPAENHDEEGSPFSEEKNDVCIVEEQNEMHCISAVPDEDFSINLNEDPNAADMDDSFHRLECFEEYQIDEVVYGNKTNDVENHEILLQKAEDSETAPKVAISDLGFEQIDQLVLSNASIHMDYNFPESVEDDTKISEVIQDCQLDYSNAEQSELDRPIVDDDDTVNKKSLNVRDSEEQENSHAQICNLLETGNGNVDDMNMKDKTTSDINISFNKKINKSQEENTCMNLNLIIKSKRSVIDEDDESKSFNPREPNFLPVKPEEEAEKVDLKHQTEDERKNSEEWMLDYALRQAVTKLAPARSRRVALLVEAFETVKPAIPKYETHRRHSSSSFISVRPLQTCI